MRTERRVAGRNPSQGAGSKAQFGAVLFDRQVFGEAVERLPEDALEHLPEAPVRGPPGCAT